MLILQPVTETGPNRPCCYWNSGMLVPEKCAPGRNVHQFDKEWIWHQVLWEAPAGAITSQAHSKHSGLKDLCSVSVGVDFRQGIPPGLSFLGCHTSVYLPATWLNFTPHRTFHLLHGCSAGLPLASPLPLNDVKKVSRTLGVGMKRE